MDSNSVEGEDGGGNITPDSDSFYQNAYPSINQVDDEELFGQIETQHNLRLHPRAFRSGSLLNLSNHDSSYADDSGDDTDNSYLMVSENNHGNMQPTSWRLRMKLIVLLILLVLCGTCETISYTVNGKVHMSVYRCFLNEFVVLSCILFFFVLRCAPQNLESDDRSEAFDYQSVGNYSEGIASQVSTVMPGNASSPKDNTRSLFWYMFVMAFCDSLALYVNLLASKSLGAALRIIMQQLTIPLSMLFSLLLLRRTFSIRHVLSAFLVVFGIALCLVNVLKGDPGQNSSASWAIIFALSCFPLTISGCLKEWVLINPTFQCDANYLNQWVATFQFLIGLAALPLGIYVQNLDTDSDITVHNGEILENFWAGFKCGALGMNSYESDGSPMYGKEDCSSAVISTWLYIFTVCLFNLLMLLVIMEGTAVLFFVANGVIIPLVSILSASPLYDSLGLDKESFTAWQVIGLICTVVGCIFFGRAMMYVPGAKSNNFASSSENSSDIYEE